MCVRFIAVHLKKKDSKCMHRNYGWIIGKTVTMRYRIARVKLSVTGAYVPDEEVMLL